MITRPSLRLTVCFATAALVSACAMPEKNTLNRADYRAAVSDDVFADGLDFTPAENVPPGTATYNGHVRSEAIVNGQDDFKILGDLEMRVNISETASSRGSNNVRGEITNLNLFDDAEDGFDDQGLGGTLTLNGRADAGRIDATATGVIDAVLADGISDQSATWSLDLNGDFLDNFENADVVAGDVTGGSVGGASDEYDILLTGNGRFYGERAD